MASSMRSNGSRGVSRILEKLEASLTAGNYYEAHQQYKTLSYRLTSKAQFEDAIDILYSGASKLLEKGQTESGADLAMTLLDVLNKLDATEKVKHLRKLTSIHSLIPADAVERRQFVSKSIKYTKTSTCTAGPPELHKALAETLWHEERLSEAHYHFLYATDGDSCGKFLVEFHRKSGSNPREVDLFIAQTVLQLLCLKNPATASLTFYAYVNNHPDVAKGPPFLLPLLNFLSFLLHAVRDGMSLQVFAILCEKYQPTLSRDPLYKTYLDKIGQNFFGMPAPQNSGLLGGLLGSLFSGLADDDEEAHAYSTTLPQTSVTGAHDSRTFASSDLD